MRLIFWKYATPASPSSTHGAGVHAAHARAMMWKPDVYVDTPTMALLYPPEALTAVQREGGLHFLERV
ncbi:hypothetical protein [Myxococcus stipitatus]|uniref:hypothetical protein n=1 Tax=Myxococcus stipitatus TaxID=83455 RepID=UPI0030D34B47